jgi:hypothetical protein
MSRVALVNLTLDGDVTITGTYTFDRANGGTLIVPAGSAFPASPAPGELFYRTDEDKLYRRNDGDTAWVNTNLAPVDSVNGQTGVVVLDAADVGAEVAGAVSAHEALPDPHPQYTTPSEAEAAAPVQSVNGFTGIVVLNSADVGADAAGTAAAAVAAHEALPDPHPQYTTPGEAAAAAPVQSVNGDTGTVVLDAADVGADPAGTGAAEAAAAVSAHEAAPDPHPQYTTAAEAAAAAPVQSVNGETGIVSLDAADVGADPAGTGAAEAASAVSAHEALPDPHPQYTTPAEASAAAPVQSVNGDTGVVVLDATDVGADPAGTGAAEAASAVAAHEALSDPHPGYVLESREGVANGVATLDGTGNVPASQLGNVASIQFIGWDASTNTPTLTSGVGTVGEYYRVNVAGSTNLDGITDWEVGDYAFFDGTVWRKQDNTESVVSVNGQTGTVVLGAADVGADPAGTGAAEAAAAVSAHEAAPDPHPQYTTAAEASAAAPVQSVNGDTGIVVLDAADVGADPVGTGAAEAAAAVSAHEALPDPHPQYTTTAEASAAAPVQSVNGDTGTVVLDAADVGADPAGTGAAEAAAAVSAHEAAPDPHPQYTTTAEAAAAAPVQSVNGETGAVALGAVDIPYDNTTSGLAASDVQAAIDELADLTDLAGGYWLRAAALAGTAGFDAVDFDTTEFENQPAKLRLSPTNPSRIEFLEDGLYYCSYSADITVGTNDEAQVRAVLNGSTVIPSTTKSIAGSGFAGVTGSLTAIFIVDATAGDYIEVEFAEITGTVTLNDLSATAIQVKGVKGDKGDPGAGSTVLIQSGGATLPGTFDTINAAVGLKAEDAGGGQADLSLDTQRAEFGLTGNVNFAPGPFQIPFDDTDLANSNFTLNGDGSVTCNFTGKVKVRLETSMLATASGSRSQAEAYWTLAGAEQDNTRRQHYLRQSDYGASAVSEKEVAVTSGQAIAAFGVRTQGGATVQLQGNGCLFTFERTA